MASCSRGERILEPPRDDAGTVPTAGPGTLAYQWQKNQVNLANGGRFAGVTTSTLAISSADNTDAGSYRCIVSNAHGSATSDEASLTIIGCNPGCMQNLGFEAGFTNGIGNGWTKFIRVGNVTCAEETTEVHGGSHSQEIYSPNKDNDGGVYQRFLATPGQPYTVKAWIKVHSVEREGNAEGFFGLVELAAAKRLAAGVCYNVARYVSAFAPALMGSLAALGLAGRIALCGLAKREEEIHIPGRTEPLRLPGAQTHLLSATETTDGPQIRRSLERSGRELQAQRPTTHSFHPVIVAMGVSGLFSSVSNCFRNVLP